MTYTPTKDLEVVRHRERELALAKTRAEVDALDERWQAEDRAWREAADWRTRQVSDLTQRVAALEKILGPSGKRLAGDLVAGIGDALRRVRQEERAYTAAELDRRGFITYAGTWDEAAEYPRGALVTQGGSAWVALTPAEKGLRPGKAPAWRLAVKGSESSKGPVVA